MRLNNRGWGFRQMIVISALLLITLLFVAYYIFSLYNSLDIDSGGHYATLELKIENAAIKYAKDRNYDLSNKYRITLSQLKKGNYITTFADKENKECDGYVVIDDYNFTSFIKCENFTSKGY